MTIKINDIDVYFYVKNYLLQQNQQSKTGDSCSYFSVDQSIVDKIQQEVESTYTNENIDKIIDDKGQFIINGVMYSTYNFIMEYEETIDYESLRYDIVTNLIKRYVLDSDEGLKHCAVGCLIEKEHYNPAIEESSIMDINVIEAVKKSNPQWEINFSQIRMLKMLQTIHDNVLPLNWNIYFNMIEQSDLFSHENNTFVFNVNNFVPFALSGDTDSDAKNFNAIIADGHKDYFNRIIMDISKLSFIGIDLSLI